MCTAPCNPVALDVNGGQSYHPFRFDDERIDTAWKDLQESGDYPDIEETFASNGDRYFFSTQHMSRRYAEALAEWASVERELNV